MRGRAQKGSQSAGSLARRRRSLGRTSVRQSRGAGSYLGRTAVSKLRAERLWPQARATTAPVLQGQRGAPPAQGCEREATQARTRFEPTELALHGGAASVKVAPSRQHDRAGSLSRSGGKATRSCSRSGLNVILCGRCLCGWLWILPLGGAASGECSLLRLELAEGLPELLFDLGAGEVAAERGVRDVIVAGERSQRLPGCAALKQLRVGDEPPQSPMPLQGERA
jgi:hypothetical protein